MKYAVKIMQESDAFIASVRDLAKLNSVGIFLDKAFAEALEGIETIFMMYMDACKKIPCPTAQEHGKYLFMFQF